MDLINVFNYLSKNFEEPYYSNYYEVEDLEGKYLIHLDLPGVKKESLTVKLVNGFIRVEAERKGKVAYSLKKSFKMPINASNEVSAELRDGVLTLTVPKLNNGSVKLIEVS